MQSQGRHGRHVRAGGHAQRNFSFDAGTSVFRNNVSCRSSSGTNDRIIGNADSSNQFWSGSNGSLCASYTGALNWSYASDGRLIVTTGGMAGSRPQQAATAKLLRYWSALCLIEVNKLRQAGRSNATIAPSGSLESRTATAAVNRATSTHSISWASLWLLLRQTRLVIVLRLFAR